MKKNKLMRMASALLVATLLTTSMIAGTFAKYTTSTTGNDQARVAYWGFNQDANTTIDLFDATYDNVKSEDGKNVIAPGTAKTSTFAFGYDTNKNATVSKPEVAYDFKVEVSETGSHTQLDANNSFKWTLKKGNETEKTYNTVAELTDAIKALSGDSTGTKRYEAGQLPDAFTDADEVYTVGWKWDFEGQDAKDTALGNAITLEDVNLTITITATQVD